MHTVTHTYDRTSRIHLTGVLCAALGEKFIDKKDKSTAVKLKASDYVGLPNNQP